MLSRTSLYAQVQAAPSTSGNPQLDVKRIQLACLVCRLIGTPFFGKNSTSHTAELQNYILDQRASHMVFPAHPDVFCAFHLTPFATLKVVILGQDPYHGVGQAMASVFLYRLWFRSLHRFKTFSKS